MANYASAPTQLARSIWRASQIVDAIDDKAQRFYLHHGFQPIESSSRLVMKIATARAVLH